MNYAGKFGAEFFLDSSGQHSGGQLHTETVHATGAPQDAIVVADAQLLFNGEFKRSGADLVLSDSDRELVLHDYFKGEKRAALSSPDGAHLTGDLVKALTGHVEYAQADGNASLSNIIGHVTKLVGTATAIRNGVSIILNNGDNVEKGDVVASGSDSVLGITFIDGTVFGLSSNARMVLNEMIYDPNGSNNSSLLSLVAGTITFVAGETAKHGDMKVDTPVATMGIRGTAVLCEIDFNVPSGQSAPDAKFQVLVEPDGTTGSYILFDKTTLTPLAVVDTAGLQINISNGILSQTLVPLSPEIQKLIQDLFALKFADASDTKSFQHFTDVVIQLPLSPSQFPIGSSVAPIIPASLTFGANSSGNAPVAPPPVIPHLPVAPTILTSDGIIIQRPGATGTAQVTGTLSFTDINPTDRPTVSVKFASFTYQNAGAPTLSAQQLADIQALEAALTLSPNPGNGHNGADTWTYSIPASAIAFLTPGSTLTLTYNATVDNNYGPDDQTSTAPFTITIKVAGEIWSETKEIASPAPGDWNNGANWQSGVAPTAADDVIIVTDPTQSGTPFYPVTIKSAEEGGAAAFADSVTMDDLGDIAPELDNFNTLTIGSGGLHLKADSILKNFGNISIGGIAEILQNAVLQNSGLMTLEQGGDFKDSSSITNSGTIEIAGGTLNVEVDVANSDGTMQVDGGAGLKLTNGATITQGAVTLGASSLLDIESAAGATLDGVRVTGTGGDSPSLIDIGVFTDGGSILKVQDGASIANGFMTIGANSVLDVETEGGATLDGLAVTNFGTIKIDVSTDGPSILRLEDGTSVVGGNMTIGADSILDVETEAGATLAGVAVTGTNGESPSTIEIGVETEGSSILTLLDGTSISAGDMRIASNSLLDVESELGATLDGVAVTLDQTSAVEIGVNTDGGSVLAVFDGTSFTGGKMTIAADSVLDVESPGGATLNGMAVSNAGTIQIESGAILSLSGSASVTNGLMSIAGLGTLNAGNGTTFDHVTVSGTSGPGGSAINVSGAVTFQDGTAVNGGEMSIAKGATLDIENPVTGTGASLNGVDVVNSGAIQVDSEGPGTTSITLLLDGGTQISGGTLLVHVGFPNNTIEGVVEIGTGGATFDDVNVINNNQVIIDPLATLTLTDNALVTGGTIHDEGTLSVVSASEIKNATIDGGGNVVVTDPLTLSGVTLDDVTLSGSFINLDTLTIDDTVTLNGATLSGGTIDDTGTLLVTAGEIENATIDGGGSVVVTGPLTLSGVTLDDVTLSGNFNNLDTLTIDETVTLNGATISGGTIDDTGTLLVTASEIDNATIDGGGNVVVTDPLTLSGVTLDDVTLSGNITNADTLTIKDIVTLNGATLSGGTINDTGTLFASSDSEIKKATIDGGGSLATGAVLLTLSEVTLDGVNLAGNIAIADTLTIDDTVTISSNDVSGGTIDDTGTLLAIGFSGLHNTTVDGGGDLTVASGIELRLDAVTLDDVTLSGSFNHFGGPVTIDGTVTLNGATITGSLGPLIDDTGTLLVTGASEIKNDTIDGGGNIIATTAPLTLSGVTLDDVTLSGSFTNLDTLTIDDTATLNGATLSGGTIDDTGTLLVTDSEIKNATIDGGGNVVVTDPLTLSEVTLDGVTLSGRFTNLDTLTIKDIVTLNGATLSGGTIDDTGALLVMGASEIDDATIDGGLVAALGPLTLSEVTLDNMRLVGGVTNLDTLTIEDTVTLGPATLSGGTIDDEGTLSVVAASEIDDATIGGGGDVTVAGGNTLTFSNVTLDDVTLSGSFANDDTLTIEDIVTFNGATLSGGTLDIFGVLDSTGTSMLSDVAITNTGTINIVSGKLTIDPAPFTNTGTVDVESGATLVLSGETVINAGGTLETTGSGLLDLVNTTVNNGALGGRITTAAGNISSALNSITLALGGLVTAAVGALELTGLITNNGEFDANTGATLGLENATMKGGILGGTGTIATAASTFDTLNGVTIAHGTTVTVTDGTTLDLVGTITDAGTIALGSSGHVTQLETSGAVSLGGGGNVTMTDSTHNFIVSDGSAATLTNHDTISGAGTIGDSHLTLINSGTIDATGTHPLVIDTGVNSTTTAGLVGNLLVTNNAGGILEASPGSILRIDDNVLNNGLIASGSSGGQSTASVDITGNITGTGAIDIFANAKFEIGGTVSAGQTVTFEQSNGAGLLILDDSHGFQGTIAGLTEAPTENQENQVDLRDLAYVARHMSFSYNHGVLTVSDGSDSVTLHVSGSSSGDFEFSSDQTGATPGTLLADPAATGTVTVDSDQVLGVSAASSATITFTNTSGNTGELLLADSKDFAGTIAGFTGDGTTANSDLIDVADLNFADVAVNKTTYTDNGNGTGTLALYNANGQSLDSLTFAGNYQLANFTIENDGNGNTLIVDPPVSTNSPSQGSAVVASGPNQVLTGPASSDTFIFNFAGVGHATIANFDPAADALQFAGSLFANAQAALNATHDDGHGNTVIALDAHDSITLNGVVKAQLHVADFHFV